MNCAMHKGPHPQANQKHKGAHVEQLASGSLYDRKLNPEPFDREPNATKPHTGR